MKISYRIVLTLTLAVILIFSGCDHKSENSINVKNDGFVSVEGRRIIAPDGRQIILHGINVVNKNPEEKYLGHVSEDDFARFSSWGFNVVRLGIIWDGLEHEPGVYNEAYLKGIDEMIGWATENDIYVFLDMHQDLYSVKFSDGAPLWATIDEGKEHLKGEIWSDSYLISPAVQTAFDNFWKNTPAPDGTGIQDHYINLWKHIAQRYADNKTVIGYDIMNEPFPGSKANEVMPIMLGGYAMMMMEQTGQTPPSEEELMMMWSTQREEVLNTLSTAEAYKKIIDPVEAVNAAFEKGPLMDFYQKARDVIRQVDRRHIIFIEHNYFTNMGVPGGLQNLVDKKGNKDPLVVYAAHGYDLVVDTDALSRGSSERVQLIFDRVNETSLRLDIPVMVGEWGALHGDSPEMVSPAQVLVGEFNKHLFNDTFWAFYRGIQGTPFFEVIKKPYVQGAPGTLMSYRFDYNTSVFDCIWKEDPAVNLPVKVWVPDLSVISEDDIKVSPAGANVELEAMGNTNGGYVIVTAEGKAVERSLKLKLGAE